MHYSYTSKTAKNGWLIAVPLQSAWLEFVGIMKTIVFLYVLSLLFTATANSASFVVEGAYTIRLQNHPERIVADRKGEFKVQVDGECWLIRVTEAIEGIESFQAGSDGTNVYSVITHTRKGPPNDAEAEVIPGTVPLGSTHMALPIVWLAYCSSAYLDGHRGQLPEIFTPPGNLNPFLFTNTLEIATERFSDPLHLPKWVASFQPGTRPQWLNHEAGPWVYPPVLVNRHKPFDKPSTNSIYLVSATTNLGNLTVPLKSTFSRFIEKPNALTENEVTLAYTIELKGSRIAVGTNVLLPSVGDRTSICSDYRFATSLETPVKGSLFYTFHSDWLSDTSVRSLPDFREQVYKGQKFIIERAQYPDGRPVPIVDGKQHRPPLE